MTIVIPFIKINWGILPIKQNKANKKPIKVKLKENLQR